MALTRARDGYFIGMTVGNVRQKDSKLVPRLNFSLPFAVLRPLFTYANIRQEPSLLNEVEDGDPEVLAIWKVASILVSCPNRV
jgi:hypothetical protein